MRKENKIMREQLCNRTRPIESTNIDQGAGFDNSNERSNSITGLELAQEKATLKKKKRGPKVLIGGKRVFNNDQSDKSPEVNHCNTLNPKTQESI